MPDSSLYLCSGWMDYFVMAPLSRLFPRGASSAHTDIHLVLPPPACWPPQTSPPPGSFNVEKRGHALAFKRVSNEDTSKV